MQVVRTHLKHSKDPTGADVFIVHDPCEDKFVDWAIDTQDEQQHLKSDEIGSSAIRKEQCGSHCQFSETMSMLFQSPNDDEFLGCSPLMDSSEQDLGKSIATLMWLEDDEVCQVSNGRVPPAGSSRRQCATL